MTRSSKSQRKNGAIPKAVPGGFQTPPNSNARRVFGNYLAPDAFTTTSSKMALDALKDIIDGKGNLKAWDTLMVRLYAGSFMYRDYFKKDAGIALTVNWAVSSMQLIMMRVLDTSVAEMMMRPTEMQYVIDALSVIDTLTLYMQAQEVLMSYHNAGKYIDSFIADNQAASKLFEERQAMVALLAQERQNAKEVPELESAT